MSIVITLLTVFLVMVSLLLILVTLMQRPKQEGLGAAFGGGMMNDTFGAQTTDVLQKGTVWLTVAFFTAAIMLTILNTRSYENQRNVGNILEGVQKPEAFPSFPAPGALPATDAATPPATDSKTPATKTDSADAKADAATKTEPKNAKSEKSKPAAKASEPAKSTPASSDVKANKGKEKSAGDKSKKASPPAKTDAAKTTADDKDKK